MTLEEELERCIQDRNEAEDDIDFYEMQIRDLELRGITDDENDEYAGLDGVLNELCNEVMYLNSVIEDLKYQIAEKN